MARRIEDEIARLAELRHGERTAATALLRKALGDRVALVAAKAATVSAELQLTELIPDLLRAFDRLFENLPKSDPQCWGKKAIAAALKDLDYSEAAPFLRGAAHVQIEPSYGRPEDTAGPLRGTCLLALPACTDIRREDVLRCMVEALVDSDPMVRAEAARGFGAMGGDESAMVLRLKARVGDEEWPVTGHVLESLLIVERARALDFVKTFLNPAGGETAEEAALALGSSRMSGAVDLLLEAWKDAKGEGYRGALARALSISRDDRAVDHLRAVAREGDGADAKAAREALELYPDSSATSG
jgi:HEAT repeat protein